MNASWSGHSGDITFMTYCACVTPFSKAKTDSKNDLIIEILTSSRQRYNFLFCLGVYIC